VFGEELTGFDDNVIDAALKEHPRRSGYMPRLNEIIALCVEFKKRKHVAINRSLPAPAKLSDEQIKLNLQRIKELRKKIGRSI